VKNNSWQEDAEDEKSNTKTRGRREKKDSEEVHGYASVTENISDDKENTQKTFESRRKTRRADEEAQKHGGCDRVRFGGSETSSRHLYFHSSVRLIVPVATHPMSTRTKVMQPSSPTLLYVSRLFRDTFTGCSFSRDDSLDFSDSRHCK